MDRAVGFYWVRYSSEGDWEIARWDGEYWLGCGSELDKRDGFWDEIGERVQHSPNLSQD